MFTQLFGHYLLNKGIVDSQQLRFALGLRNNTRVKLGALAIDAGYMTAEQVEQVHAQQRRSDRMIGDIAVEMGFLTNGQVEELLSKQKTANIVIGQALIDLGYITNKQFEEALAEYKRAASFKEGTQSDEQLAEELVKVFGLPQEQFYVDYLLLMVRNLIRFVGDDFAFAGCANAQEVYPCLCLQEIGGAESASTAICCDEDVFAVLASRYAGEEISSADEFAEACVGELLNLQNGLFAVNRSNSAGVELELTPQQALRNAQVPVGAVAVRLAYSFGTVTIAVKKI